MDHILVEWVNENPRQFSVCRRVDIVDGDLRDKVKGLENVITLIQWKRRQYPGKILKIGSEDELEELADSMAIEEQTKMVTPVKKVGTKPRKSVRNLEDSLNEVLANLPGPSSASSSASAMIVEDLNHDEETSTNDLCDGYKEKYKNLKRKYKDLKVRYKALKQETDSDEMVDLGDETGVKLKKSDIEKMKLMSGHTTHLARNLFRQFFSFEELSTHSLFGKKCNANKNQVPLPSLDPTRRDAIIGFVLKENGLDLADCCGNKERTMKRKSARREVVKTLSDFLREHRNAKAVDNE